MSTYVYQADSQRLQTGLGAIGLPVSATPTPDFTCSISCYLYRNPDGSIRWIWPVGADQPDFLRFYQVGSQRAQVFIWLVRLLFRLKLGRLVAQDRLILYTTVDGYQLFRRSQLNRWALFMGTPSPNRKLVLWYSTRSSKSYFLKIALTSPATNTLRQEALALRQVQRVPFLELETPRLKSYSGAVLIQEDMGLADGRQTTQLADFPSGALQELVSRNWHTQLLQQTDFWLQARETVSELWITNDPRIPVSLLIKLEQLMRSINEQSPVPLAAAHGDFTPRNALLMGDRLCVVDWALYQAGLPGLYDLFHFLYQSTTLIEHKGYGVIRQQIDATLNQPEWQLFRERHPIDTNLSEMLYLVHTITHHLSAYSRQEEWHQQTDWQLTTWNDALTYWLNRTQAVSAQKLLLHDLAFWSEA
ncbi:hypothetical protein EXU85_22995 [Spirosoma sp. KCTC 42546]|uniref:hypothetical protein n=1 Tax=Spirosoma sp. KCTC 42546 TaxID=2520506 RepID=UPI00115BEB17|nr:hypothetical protein [Spirosoma sp. KCTC 42546]QDK81320.1 hypothetical protein EXU85_22995 [Spirosoma sp. KCTC 42546]